jgi:type I restriction enzyme, S subunit
LVGAKFPLSTIGDHFYVRDGDHAQLPDEEIRTAADGIRYLRSQDLCEGEITSKDAIYISSSYFNKLPRSHIKPGYLLFSIMASIGNSAVVPDGFPPATANRAVGILAPKTENKHLTWYLFYLFLTNLGTELYARIKKGGLQQRTNLADVAVLEFPLPPDSKLRELVATMEAARASHQQKLAEADALLAGFDGYLLAQLGLAAPAPDARQVFAVRLGQLRDTGRVNADYFHPERILAIRAMEKNRKTMRVERLRDIADFVRDAVPAETSENYLGLANVQSNTGELVESTEEDGVGLCFRFAPQDVLFARLRPYLNKVHRAEKTGVCSTEFHVIRIHPAAKPQDEIRADYLATVLRSSLVLAQTRHMMTGNTHPRLANEDVVNLVVPLPDPKIQEIIAAEVTRRRTEARRLRSSAGTEWAAAKARFEQELWATHNQCAYGKS